MGELRVALDRIMAQLDSPPGAYNRFVRYKARKVRRRRVAAAGVGLLVAAGSLLILVEVFTSPPAREPASPTAEVRNGKIVFAGSQDGAYDLYEMEADGTQLTNLTNTIDVAEFEPAWSPDGSRIAFVRCLECTTTDIYVMNADGSGISRVTDDLAYDGGPAWSPDGSLLAYHSDPNPVSSSPDADSTPRNEDIYVINPDGSGRRRLTSDPARELNASWSRTEPGSHS